jgi:hypothetical protein
MLESQVFEEMLRFYNKFAWEMKCRGEFDWYTAARQTQRRLAAYLYGNLSETPLQLARECHADLQGYVQVKFGSNIMNLDRSNSSEDYYALYELGQRLMLMGGAP